MISFLCEVIRFFRIFVKRIEDDYEIEIIREFTVNDNIVAFFDAFFYVTFLGLSSFRFIILLRMILGYCFICFKLFIALISLPFYLLTFRRFIYFCWTNFYNNYLIEIC